MGQLTVTTILLINVKVQWNTISIVEKSEDVQKYEEQQGRGRNYHNPNGRS